MGVCHPKRQLHPQGGDTLICSMFEAFMGVGVPANGSATDLSGEYHVICLYV